MMLENYLNKAVINPNLMATAKEDIIREISGLIAGSLEGLTTETIANALSEREHLGSTGIDKGVAIPHAKIEGIKQIIIALGRSRNGIDFESQDGLTTHLIFAMLAPANAAGEHLKVLARLAKVLGIHDLKERIIGAKDAEEMYNILIEADKKL